jgi:hypothetical protein
VLELALHGAAGPGDKGGRRQVSGQQLLHAAGADLACLKARIQWMVLELNTFAR